MTAVQFHAWAEDLRSKYGIAQPFAEESAEVVCE